jgi:hypothetical protein
VKPFNQILIVYLVSYSDRSSISYLKVRL